MRRNLWGSYNTRIARYNVLLTTANGSSSILTGWTDTRFKEKYTTQTKIKGE